MPKHDWATIDPQLTALYELGLSGQVIGQRMKMSGSTVRHRLRMLGLRGTVPGVTPEPLRVPVLPAGAPVCPKRATRKMCAEAFGVSEADLMGPRRFRALSIPRQAVFYVLRHRFPKMSYPSIARMFGDRDHSTVIFGVAKTEVRMQRDPALRAVVRALIAGHLPEQHDGHVRAWLMRDAPVRPAAPTPAPVRPAAPTPAPVLSAPEQAVPPRHWCDQCQANVTQAAAARCSQRFCSLVSARQVAAFA